MARTFKNWRDRDDQAERRASKESKRGSKEGLSIALSGTAEGDSNRPLSESEVSYYEHYTGLTQLWQS